MNVSKAISGKTPKRGSSVKKPSSTKKSGCKSCG